MTRTTGFTEGTADFLMWFRKIRGVYLTLAVFIMLLREPWMLRAIEAWPVPKLLVVFFPSLVIAGCLGIVVDLVPFSILGVRHSRHARGASDLEELKGNAVRVLKERRALLKRNRFIHMSLLTTLTSCSAFLLWGTVPALVLATGGLLIEYSFFRIAVRQK